MRKKPADQNKANDLRLKAEAKVKETIPKNTSPLTESDIFKQTHELLVQQVELEIQNETLMHEKQSEGDALKLNHELEVHRTELEMQNEELRQVIMSTSDVVKLNQELKVHQEELEMQNHELRLAIATAKDATDLYDFAPTGFFTLSASGEIRKLNNSGATLLGKEISRATNSRFAFFVSEDSRPIFNLFLERVFSSNTKEACEITLVGHGKKTKYVHLLGIAAKNADFCLVTVTDITEHRHAEEITKLNEEKYRYMFANSPEPMWIFDTETLAFLEVNHAAVVHYGYSAEEFLAMTLKDIRSVEDIPELMKNVESTDRTYNQPGEFRHIKKNGEIIDVLITWHSVIFNGHKARHVLVNDITKRKQAERALEIQNELLSKITQFSIDLSALPAAENLEAFIAKRIKEITGALFVSYSEYDPINRIIMPRHIDMDPGILKKAVSLMGSQIQKVHSPVDEETYLKITEKIIEKYDNLTDATFGAIPKTISSLLSVLLKSDRYIGIAFIIEGKLYGTSLLAMGKNQFDPSIELLQNIAFLVAISIRRKQAEDAKTQSEVRYRMLYENSLTGILITHPDGSILAANPEACRILEHTEPEICTIGRKGIMDLSNPLLTSALAERAQTGQFRGELTFVRSDATIFPVDIVSAIFSDTTGQIHSNIFFRDITKRKLAEEALQQEQWRLASIIEGTNVGTWEWNVQTGEAIYNEQWAQIIGYSFDELIPLNISTWEKFAHPDDLKKSTEVLQKHFAGELPHYECECRMKHKDGRWIWVHDRGRIITQTEDGKPLMMFGTHTDITERKQAEEVIQESEFRYRTLVELSPFAIVIHREGKIIFVNPAAVKMFGAIQQHELIGGSILDRIHPDFHQIVLSRLKKASNDNETAPVIELRYLKLDGTIIEGEVQGMSIIYNGEPAIQVVINDITERKRAENALRETESRFRLAADNAPVLIWQSGTDALCNYFNQPWLIFTGRTFKQEYGNGWAEGVHPDDLQKCLDIYTNSFKEQKSFEMEYRLRRADGEYRWLLDHGIPRFTTDGEFQGYIGSCFDITENKQVQDALSESESRFRRLYELASLGIFQSTPEGKVISVNPSFAKMFGYNSPEELKDKISNVSKDLFADPNRRKEIIRLLGINPELNSFENVYRRKDGSMFTGWLNITRVNDEHGRFDHMEGFIEDITDRKRNEEALKESETRFKNLFKYHSAIMLLIEPESGLILDANDAAAHFYGYSKSVLQSMKIDDINVLSKEQVKLEREKARHNNLNYFVFEHKLANDQVRTVEVHSSPINFEGKQILFSIIHDITERKRIEQEIKQSNEKLLNANAEKDKFFSIVAHDLRGPFGNFAELTHLLAEGMPDMTLDEMRKIIYTMNKSAVNLNNLLSNLLEWSRMQRGLIVFDPVNFLLMPKMADVIVMIIEAADKKEIAVQYNVPGDLEVYADVNMLLSIMRNLLTNAVKFTPKGGTIEVSVNADKENKVEISIHDSGIGMSADMIANLFRLDSNTGRKGTAGEATSGLGLIICKDFITKLGGGLHVESEVGKGSTFRFSIPGNMSDDTVVKKSVPADQNIRKVKSLKILIAEDDEISVMLMSIAFKKFSREIIKVKSGTDAVEACRKHPDIDLVLMDIKMPGLDGYEATRQIRQFNPEVVIIAETAFGHPADRKNALEAGCNEYITKPFDSATLVGIIRKFFDV